MALFFCENGLPSNGNVLGDEAIAEALEQGAKDISYPLNGDNSYVRGQTGAWNKDLNLHPLIPNKIYNVNGFKYHTNAQGKVTKVEISNLQKSTPPWDRNRYQQSLKCNKAKDGVVGQDQGGHLIAAQFGGPGEQINLIPMRKTLNQSGGDWYNMEQMWATKVQNGIGITDIQIDILYGSNGRPLTFDVTWKENGNLKELTHNN